MTVLSVPEGVTLSKEDCNMIKACVCVYVFDNWAAAASCGPASASTSLPYRSIGRTLNRGPARTAPIIGLLKGKKLEKLL